MTLHDLIEGAVGLAITVFFALGLGLLAHDVYIYLYVGTVDWFTSDLVIDYLAGDVCSAGAGWVGACEIFGRIHGAFLVVAMGSLFVALFGAAVLAVQGSGRRLVVFLRDRLPIPIPGQPTR